MIIKALARGVVAAGAVAATVHAVRKYDLVTKAAVLANTAVEKAATGAEKFIAKGVGITDELLARFAEDQTSSEDEKSFEQERHDARATGRVPQGDVWSDATRGNGGSAS